MDRLIPGSLIVLWRAKNIESKVKASGNLYITDKFSLPVKILTNKYKEQDGYDLNICIQGKDDLHMIGKLRLQDSSGYIEICNQVISLAVTLYSNKSSTSPRPDWIIFPKDYDHTRVRRSEEQVYIEGRGWTWPEEMG